MPRRLARTGRIEPCLLQREVPLSRTVSILNEHQGWIVSQPLGLLNHGQLILCDKPFAEELCDGGDEGDGIEDIPCGVDVDPAGICNRRRYGCQAGKPFFAAADGFESPVGENKIDGRRDGFAVNTEQLIRSAVSRGGMRRHAEAFGNGLEMLLFFVNAGALPPPPGLVDEWTVRR